MRKLILETQLTIDGYLAGINRETDWMIWNWGPDWSWDKELQKYHTALTTSVDCILLSRQMADDGFIAHWQRVSEDPGDPQFVFAKHITGTHKVIFSKTLDKSTAIPGGWHNTSVANGDLAEEINTLKKQRGEGIIAYGGSAFVSSLIRAGLVDEFHLLVNPVAIGKGLPVFKDLGGKQDMTLIRSQSFDCGIVLLYYRPVDNGNNH